MMYTGISSNLSFYPIILLKQSNGSNNPLASSIGGESNSNITNIFSKLNDNSLHFSATKGLVKKYYLRNGWIASGWILKES